MSPSSRKSCLLGDAEGLTSTYASPWAAGGERNSSDADGTRTSLLADEALAFQRLCAESSTARFHAPDYPPLIIFAFMPGQVTQIIQVASAKTFALVPPKIALRASPWCAHNSQHHTPECERHRGASG